MMVGCSANTVSTAPTASPMATTAAPTHSPMATAEATAEPDVYMRQTFANRLSVQLRVSGKRPLAISLDNYYKNREMIPLGADGKPDLECLESIDVALFNDQLVELLAGREVELPLYSFKTKPVSYTHLSGYIMALHF